MVDEQDVVPILQQFPGDGPAYCAGPGDRDAKIVVGLPGVESGTNGL